MAQEDEGVCEREVEGVKEQRGVPVTEGRRRESDMQERIMRGSNLWELTQGLGGNRGGRQRTCRRYHKAQGQGISTACQYGTQKKMPPRAREAAETTLQVQKRGV